MMTKFTHSDYKFDLAAYTKKHECGSEDEEHFFWLMKNNSAMLF